MGQAVGRRPVGEPYNKASFRGGSLKLLPAGETLGACAEQLLRIISRKSEGAGVFIHQLSLATGGRLLLVGVLMLLHLPPAHGQAKLSEAGSRDQRKFSGKEMLVACGGGQRARKRLG